MSRALIHIYGPISIQTFGLFIAIGLSLFIWLVHQHKKRKNFISEEQFSTVTFIGILSGIIGGRLLFVAQEYQNMSGIIEVLSFWEGGFSILGTIIFALGGIFFYLKKIQVPVLPFLDLIALYAPLAQSISRIGCFFAGCCYGTPSSLLWAIYPMNCKCISLHPTQLYSSFSLFIIFLFMRFVATKFCSKPGQLISLYIFLAGIERFAIGFWRGDSEFFTPQILRLFSIHQWIGLLVGTAGLTIFFGSTYYHRQPTK